MINKSPKAQILCFPIQTRRATRWDNVKCSYSSQLSEQIGWHSHLNFYMQC